MLETSVDGPRQTALLPRSLPKNLAQKLVPYGRLCESLQARIESRRLITNPADCVHGARCRAFLATWATYAAHQGNAGKREAFLLAIGLAVTQMLFRITLERMPPPMSCLPCPNRSAVCRCRMPEPSTTSCSAPRPKRYWKRLPIPDFPICIV
jgi:hypothetical protein